MFYIEIRIQGTNDRKTIKVSRVPIRNEYIQLSGDYYQVGDVYHIEISEFTSAQNTLAARVFVVRTNTGCNPF